MKWHGTIGAQPQLRVDRKSRVPSKKVVRKGFQRIGINDAALNHNSIPLETGIHFVMPNKERVGRRREFNRIMPGDLGESSERGVVGPDKLSKSVETKETSLK